MKRISDDLSHIEYSAQSANLGIRISEHHAFAITLDGEAAWVQLGDAHEIPIDERVFQFNGRGGFNSNHHIAVALRSLSAQEKSEVEDFLRGRKSIKDAVEGK